MRLWIRVVQRVLYALYRQRLAVALVLVLVGGAGAYLSLSNTAVPALFPGGTSTPSTIDPSSTVEVTVQQPQDPPAGTTATSILTLKETHGNRRISMTLGRTETLAIADEKGMQLVEGGQKITGEQQPQVYNLMGEMIRQMGAHVDRVVISNETTNREYVADILISNGSGDAPRALRARPGDAIALALKLNAPIYAENKVFGSSGRQGSS